MGRCNSEEALGAELAGTWDRWDPLLASLAAQVHRVETDNRLHAWEWRVMADGTILKTDAIDHHAGHDLVGCQDIAWDVAGAAVELDLTDAEERRLMARVAARSGRDVSEHLVAFLRPCYLAFQLGHYREAEMASRDPREAARLAAASARYAERLRQTLASAKKQANADEKSALAQCDTKSGDAKSQCRKDAKASRDKSMADAEAAHDKAKADYKAKK